MHAVTRAGAIIWKVEMHRGALFVFLFFVIAPGVAVGLLWRGVRRGTRESKGRWKILGLAATALALWTLLSDYMFNVTFVMAWDVAHMRPSSAIRFPEGWPIYAWLAAYAALGWALIVALGRVPSPRAK